MSMQIGGIQTGIGFQQPTSLATNKSVPNNISNATDLDALSGKLSTQRKAIPQTNNSENPQVSVKAVFWNSPNKEIRTA